MEDDGAGFDYAATRQAPPTTAKKGGLMAGGMGQILVTVIIAFVATIGWSMYQGYVGKSQYVADITRLESDLVSMRDGEKAQTDQIASIGSTATAAANAASKAATQQSIVDLQNKDAAFTTQLSALQTTVSRAVVPDQLLGYVKASELATANATIAALQKEVAALQTAVTALQSAGTPGSGVVNGTAITVAVDTLGNLPMTMTGISNTAPSTAMFRIKLTNTSTKQLNNVSLTATIMSNTGLPAMATGFPLITGTLSPFTLAQANGPIMVFVNGWGGIGATGLNLGPNASVTLYPVLNLQAAAAGAWNTQTFLFSPTVTVNSYDVG